MTSGRIIIVQHLVVPKPGGRGRGAFPNLPGFKSTVPNKQKCVSDGYYKVCRIKSQRISWIVKCKKLHQILRGFNHLPIDIKSQNGSVKIRLKSFSRMTKQQTTPL